MNMKWTLDCLYNAWLHTTHTHIHSLRVCMHIGTLRLMGGQIEWNWRFRLPTTLVTFDTLLSSTIILKNVLNNMLLARHPLKFTCHMLNMYALSVCAALSLCVNTGYTIWIWMHEICVHTSVCAVEFTDSHNKWSITSWKHEKTMKQQNS